VRSYSHGRLSNTTHVFKSWPRQPSGQQQHAKETRANG